MSPDDVAPRPADVFWKLRSSSRIASQLPFGSMKETEIEALLGCATVQRLDANATCFEEGGAADSFYLLLEGTVRIAKTTPEGEQVIVLHVMPGQLFGIARAFENDSYHTSARAVSDVLVLRWPSLYWDQFSRDYPGFLSAARRVLGARFADMQRRIMAMATLKVEQRIARAILDLVDRAGLPTKEGIEIGFPITRQDISEMTGTTLHSVSRYMSKWQRSGIVTSKRRRVIVRQPKALPI